ncbi:hypothetical protein ACFVUN_34670 [Kitasatospora griseola]|uniref:hypothetical protein n=1 Tax=Kitasatospora griseola TaxID=2064 RepID=UPI0036DECC2F
MAYDQACPGQRIGPVVDGLKQPQGSVVMHRDVGRLITVLPPHEGAGESIDWNEVERTWGTPFPKDFQDFMAVYGVGGIDDFMAIATPADGEHVPGMPRIRSLTPTADSLRRSGMSWPYPVWPQRGGLIGWGGNSNASDFYWDTADTDPDNWPVVVRHREGTFVEYRCSMTVFILGLLGPRHTRPMENPMIYGAPNSRFYHWREERRLSEAGVEPWEYLDELFEANEAEDEMDEDDWNARPETVPLAREDVLPPGAFPPPGRIIAVHEYE